MRWVRLQTPVLHSSFPCQIGIGILAFIRSLVIYFKTGIGWTLLLTFLFGIFVPLLQWWQELLIEYIWGPQISLQEYDNFKLGLVLLILTEAIFFVSLLWAFFHFSLSPSIWVGHVWPPFGIVPISPKGIPLLNTFLLLRRGVTVTWAHHLLIAGEKSDCVKALVITMFLGVWFLVNQYFELKEAPFRIRDGVFGRILFVLTGFHGLHVLLGLIFLEDTEDCIHNFHNTSLTHTKTDIFIWYWHLVDCVWLLVYIFIYWWGR